MARLLFLEFNEISFENVAYYCSRGQLPHFRELIEERGWSTTRSEQEYEHLEPWIQWVTAHTGLSYAEHGVFRLGDIVNRDVPQIWEQLEEYSGASTRKAHATGSNCSRWCGSAIGRSSSGSTLRQGC